MSIKSRLEKLERDRNGGVSTATDCVCTVDETGARKMPRPCPIHILEVRVPLMTVEEWEAAYGPTEDLQKYSH